MNDIICSGALFYALNTKRFLFIHRTRGRHKCRWGLVGGTNEGVETPWQGLQREIQEEIGDVNIHKAIPLESFVSKDSRFFFHTYLTLVKEEFLPLLNDEHDGYAWVSYNMWPRPLHSGLHNTLKNSEIRKKLDTVIAIAEHL
jgi:8-oxo-dGTP pyrophosphatase MutT (NUDIX family)